MSMVGISMLGIELSECLTGFGNDGAQRHAMGFGARAAVLVLRTEASVLSVLDAHVSVGCFHFGDAAGQHAAVGPNDTQTERGCLREDDSAQHFAEFRRGDYGD